MKTLMLLSTSFQPSVAKSFTLTSSGMHLFFGVCLRLWWCWDQKWWLEFFFLNNRFLLTCFQWDVSEWTSDARDPGAAWGRNLLLCEFFSSSGCVPVDYNWLTLNSHGFLLSKVHVGWGWVGGTTELKTFLSLWNGLRRGFTLIFS